MSEDGSTAIVLDFDGTLVDADLRRKKAREIAKGTLMEMGNFHPSLNEMEFEVRKVIESSALLDLDTPFQGLHQMLIDLKKHPKLVIVIYSARQNENALIAQITRLGLIGEIDLVVSSGGQKKSWEALRERVGVIPIATVAGDSQEDFELAQGLGCPFIRVDTSGSPNIPSLWGGPSVRDMAALHEGLLKNLL